MLSQLFKQTSQQHQFKHEIQVLKSDPLCWSILPICVIFYLPCSNTLWIHSYKFPSFQIQTCKILLSVCKARCPRNRNAVSPLGTPEALLSGDGEDWGGSSGKQTSPKGSCLRLGFKSLDKEISFLRQGRRLCSHLAGRARGIGHEIPSSVLSPSKCPQLSPKSLPPSQPSLSKRRKEGVFINSVTCKIKLGPCLPGICKRTFASL